VVPRSFSARRKKRKSSLLETVISMVILVGIALFTMQFGGGHSPSLITSITQPGCVIKGNVSIATGNKLYHLPGMEDYASTKIDPAHGEMWFCTESEAITNGWRRAPR
jgi:hypothetical protein